MAQGMLLSQPMVKVLKLILLNSAALIALVLVGCGPIKTSFKSKPAINPNSAPAAKSDKTKSEVDLVTDVEKEDDYANPFEEINGQFDANSPEVRNDFTPKGEVKDQAVGTYSGATSRLEHPSNLFFRELTYVGLSPFKILYPSRKTFFGTSDMIEMIDYLAQHVKNLIPRLKLLIGDISAEHGGRLGGHDSHRIGMDVDVAYLQAGNRQVEGFQSMVGGDISQKILLKEQLQIFKFAVITQRVDRIFVHPQIKSALCETAKSLGAFDDGKDKALTMETLRRLIPETNHGNHFHLRLKCSKSQPRCIPMADPANRTGCQ